MIPSLQATRSAPAIAALALALLGAARANERSGEIDEALARARTTGGFVAVIVVGGSGPDGPWIEDQLRSAEWRSTLGIHEQVVVRADRRPSVAAHLGARRFPQLVLLDGEGREVGRLEGRQPAAALARKLRDAVEAAERFRSLEAALRADPSDIEALFWIGTYRWNRGERSQAVILFRRVLELAPTSPSIDPEILASAMRQVAEDCLDCGRFREGEEFFLRALSLAAAEESRCRSALGLSMSLRRQGRTAEAIAVLERSLAAAPESRLADQTLYALGYLYRELGDTTASRRHLEACRRRFPESIYGQRSGRHLDGREDLSPLRVAARA